MQLKIIKESSPEIRKQIERELKTLYRFKSKRNESQSKESQKYSLKSDSNTSKGEEDQTVLEDTDLEKSLRQLGNRADIVDFEQIENDMDTVDAARMRRGSTNDMQSLLSEKLNDPHLRGNFLTTSASLEPAAGLESWMLLSSLERASTSSEDSGSTAVPFLLPDDPPCSKDIDSFPYITKLYDAYVSSDGMSVCLVLEYMAGGSLKSYILKGKPAGEKEVSIVAYSVLQALVELHSRNIIHRDIKPANILIKGDGAVKLSDFGISRECVLDDSDEIMTFIGSIAYMSPERIRGDKYGISSDIWSLGITLIYFITCKQQFSHCTSYWRMLDALECQNPTIDERGTAKCSKELNDFLDMCLEKDPSSRPSAAQLLESKFILEAISIGAISRSVQPKLMKPNKIPTPAIVVQNVVNDILDWWPEHKSEMILIEPRLSNDASSVASEGVRYSSQHDYEDSRRLFADSATDQSNKPLYSKKAVFHLSSILSVHPTDVMRIIICRHLIRRKKERQNKNNGKSKDKLFNSRDEREILNGTINPLYPYAYENYINNKTQ